jgi:hypothetical protein
VEAISRLVTANFLHISLTGIAGAWLFELVRSKFHRASEFLIAFVGVVAAHALYDYATTAEAHAAGIDIAGILILAFSAKMYFEKLRPQDVELRRRTVSCTAVFCIGGAVLTGMVIITAIAEMNSLRGATAALRSIVSIFPIVILFVREFREV